MFQIQEKASRCLWSPSDDIWGLTVSFVDDGPETGME